MNSPQEAPTLACAKKEAPVAQEAALSDHPYDVWQTDASICTLFYVPGERQSGL